MPEAIPTEKTILDEPFFYFFRPREGWVITQVTPDSCKVLDEKGRFRINVLLIHGKLHLGYLQRYTWDYGGDQDDDLSGVVTDRARNDKVVFQTETFSLPTSDIASPAHQKVYEQVDNLVDVWLAENRPNHDDPMAYWDDPDPLSAETPAS